MIYQKNKLKIKSIENEIPNPQERATKYPFWIKFQKMTLFFFLILLVVCFVWSWWFVIPMLLLLVLNGVAYTNRMKLLGRKPGTKDINDVV